MNENEIVLKNLNEKNYWVRTIGSIAYLYNNKVIKDFSVQIINLNRAENSNITLSI